MGYTTDFEGNIGIVPALTDEEVSKLNEFMGERHDGDGFPGIWCDWEVHDTGSMIAWNDSEKSYSMPEWMVYLIQNFLQGHTLNGTMSAQGEEPDDMWLLHVKDNIVSVEDLVAQPSGSETVIGGPVRQISDGR